jgi:DNA-directed RNA polymerase specialized sigma24 family protein
VSTRFEPQTQKWSTGLRASPGARAHDPVEDVAIVARAKRELLLRAHRHRLRREDLEDCYSVATLELLAHARQGGAYASRLHIANALELRFVSRIRDRRRAIAGRSPMQAALETAVPLGAEHEIAIVDRRAEVERQVMLRHDLRRVQVHAQALSPDQRLVLAHQLLLDGGCADFCRRFGWSGEKYRKVAQRARARLRTLMALDEADVPPAQRSSEVETGTAYDHHSPRS